MLLQMPERTGRFLFFKIFLRLINKDLPGRKENPFWISGWDLVELMSSM